MKRYIHTSTQGVDKVMSPKTFVKRVLTAKLGHRPTRMDRGQLTWWNNDLPFERGSEVEQEYIDWFKLFKEDMLNNHGVLVSEFIDYPTSWNFRVYPEKDTGSNLTLGDVYYCVNLV